MDWCIYLHQYKNDFQSYSVCAIALNNVLILFSNPSVQQRVYIILSFCHKLTNPTLVPLKCLLVDQVPEPKQAQLARKQPFPAWQPEVSNPETVLKVSWLPIVSMWSMPLEQRCSFCAHFTP